MAPSYNEFERTFQYSEQRDEEGVQYHDISVTLQPVRGGNVHTRNISRDEFLRDIAMCLYNGNYADVLLKAENTNAARSKM